MTEIILFGAIMAGAYYLSKEQNPMAAASNAASNIDPTVFPLKLGSKSIFVGNLQKALINKGGDIAHLILSSGGETGVLNEQTAKAINLSGYAMPLTETDYRSLINNTLVLRNIAYVIDVEGSALYRSVGNEFIPNYGYGRELIMTLPVKTHLGTATGNYKNGMVEIATTINTAIVKFWVPTSKVAMISQTEYDIMKATKLLEKSVDAKMKLLNY